MCDNFYENNIVDDVFECSECDYKSTTERGIIDHSVTHQIASSASNNSLSDQTSNYNSFNYVSEDTNARFIPGNELERENQHSVFVKTEQTIYEVITSENIDQGYEVKDEDVNIKKESMANSSLRLQVNGCNPRNLGTTIGLNNIQELIKDGEIIDLDIDNTGIYIPTGWMRKVFIRTKLCPIKKLVVFEPLYFTVRGYLIKNRQKAYAYCIRNPLEKIEINKLDFTVKNAKKAMAELDQSKLVFDVDNTGVYIPKGWSRKIKVTVSDDLQLHYKVIFIHPKGKIFFQKSEIVSYVSNIEKDKHIDLEKLDFSNRRRKISGKIDMLVYVRHLLDSEKLIEINVDITNIYIPPGWNRRVFMRRWIQDRTIMFHCCYFTEEGIGIQCKDEAILYHNQNPFKKLEIDKLDFSVPTSWEILMNLDHSYLEFDHKSIIYVPKGWKRKVKVNISFDEQIYGSIVYICPSGKRFYSTSEIISYNSDKGNNVLIDIAKLNFCFGGKSSKILFIGSQPLSTI